MIRTGRTCPNGSGRGFSLMEMLLTIVLIGVLAAVAMPSFMGTKISVTETKLRRDVVNLNSSIRLYVANGGSVDGIADPQQVLNKLKTQQSAADAQRYVGPHTGRSVDVRLTVRKQNTNEASSTAPRAVWNVTKQQFDITTESGQAGIAEFTLDGDPAQHQGVVESRTQSNLLYNGQPGPGWVWASGDHPDLQRTQTQEYGVDSPPPIEFNPVATPPPPATPPAPSLTQLPTPTINPGGGAFTYGNFPSSVTIASNGAPGGSTSMLIYRITDSDGLGAGWKQYTSAVSVAPGQSVQAANLSLNQTLYRTSSLASEAFDAKLSDLPTPLITPAGGTFLPVNFPTAITINANGAPGGSASALRYLIRHKDGTSTNWTNYSSAIAVADGDTVSAANFSLDQIFFTDSVPVSETYSKDINQLPPPILTEAIVNGKRVVIMTMDPSVPAGAYIEYATNGLDPDIKSDNTPMRGSTYSNPLGVPNSPPFEVSARVYPPKGTAMDYIVSDAADLDLDFPAAAGPGIAGGHFDVDTSSQIYALGKGKTDAHTHAYDDKYNTPKIDMMALQGGKLRNIQNVIPKGIRFKLIVANAELSKAGMISINGDATSAPQYDDINPYYLPTYSIDGVSGSTKLDQLSVTFDLGSILNGGIIGTVTGAVKSNKPGANGEYRNGALTIQAVLVDSNGNAAFTTDTSLSNGGVQGVAKTGLLWEATIFWHWNGGAYGE